jgi:hypothetical protein
VLCLTDEVENTILIASAMKQDQPVDTQFGETLRPVDIKSPTRRDADLEVIEPPARCITGILKSVDALGSAVMVEREPELSLRQTCGTTVSLFGMASEDDFGMWFLRRPRHRIDAFERDKAALVFRFLH